MRGSETGHEVRRQLTPAVHPCPVAWAAEGQAHGMEELAAEFARTRPAPVAEVAHDRELQVRQVCAQLVRTPGVRPQPQQGMGPIVSR